MQRVFHLHRKICLVLSLNPLSKPTQSPFLGNHVSCTCDHDKKMSIMYPWPFLLQRPLEKCLSSLILDFC